MFNKNFYPITKQAFHGLMQGIDKKRMFIKSVLDPSAGKADLLEFAMDYIYGEEGYRTHSNRKRGKEGFYAIELEPELRAIIGSKGYTVIGSDFLSDPINMHFDYILMNPPFDKGDEHLLRAWNLMYNGTIRCILNAENDK